MPIASRIDEFRRKRGITKDALEKRAGLSAGRICKWVGGQGSPNTDQIMRIAEVLDVHPMELINNRNTPGLSYEFWRPMSDVERREVIGVCERIGYAEAMHRLLSPSLPTTRSQRSRTTTPRSTPTGHPAASQSKPV